MRGTRLAVEFLLGLYAAGWSEAQILENYPTLTPEALRAVHAFAADRERLPRAGFRGYDPNAVEASEETRQLF